MITEKAFAIVLKEQIDLVNDSIREGRTDSKHANAVMESGIIKELGLTQDSFAQLKSDFDTLEIFIRERPDHVTDEMVDEINRLSKAYGEEIKFELLDKLKGEKGDIGETGESGLDGIGKDGLDGKDGIDGIGKDGEDGLDGLDGKDGIDGIGKDGEDGLDGLDGKDGIDGLDSGASGSVKWRAGNEYRENDLVTHEGGLWRSHGTTYAEPSAEDDRWVLITNGIADIDSVSDSDSAELHVKMSDGDSTTLRIEIPHPNFTDEVWKDETDYAIRDVVWKDGHSFIALSASPAGEPGQSDDWAKYTMRGRAGRKGDKGDKGAKGLTGMDGMDAASDQKIKGFINHILAVDEGDTPIRNSAGKWTLDDSYSVGDVVSMGSGLYLCIQAHSKRAPASDHQAGDYWRVLVPAQGVGIGGGGTTGGGTVGDMSDYQMRSEKGAPSGYAGLDTSGRVQISQMPPAAAAVHHIFATQADMFAGGALISLGENVLVHGDPDNALNGEYVALIDSPSTLPDFLHLGAHVTPHRHTGADTDVTEPNAAGSETLQEYIEARYTSLFLPDIPITAGSLRQMQIGRTYELPTAQVETSPGSGVHIPVGKPEILGIVHTGINYTNMVMIRTGVQTWVVFAQEYTGTARQPTREWYLDLGQSWSDHTGIGGNEATSFSSITENIVKEIGDVTIFGAMTLVDKIQNNEQKRHDLSSRVATLEGGAAHGHVDIIQDFKIQINNNGSHFMILNDNPGNADHVGKDLYDGNEHLVLLQWDTGTPFSPAVPFDPTNVLDGTKPPVNWLDTAIQKPSVYLQKGTEFKQLVDPLSGAVFAFAAIYAFVDGGSILTVRWDNTNGLLEILKVQVPTVHVVTTPDHQPLQVGGSVDAKSVPFVSLNTQQQAAVKNNSIWLDETQTLRWRDNTGTDHSITVSPH